MLTRLLNTDDKNALFNAEYYRKDLGGNANSKASKLFKDACTIRNA
jgi:hypothetical protein